MDKDKLKSLLEFLTDHVRPMYFGFDRCHNEFHYDEVVTSAIEISSHYKMKEVEFIAVVIAAAYHDTGRLISDPKHETFSCVILKNDLFLKSYLNEVFPDIEYDKVIKIASRVISEHRSKIKTKYELSLILKDADKVSHLDKERGLYRPVAYCIDRIMPGETDINKIIMNRVKYFGGDIKFTPKSKYMKYIMNDIQKVIFISTEDITEMVKKILREG